MKLSLEKNRKEVMERDQVSLSIFFLSKFFKFVHIIFKLDIYDIMQLLKKEIM